VTRSPADHLARRTFLTGLLAAGGLAVLEPVPAAAAGAPAEAHPGPTRFGNIETHVIEGSAASAALLSGPVATLLLHVARRFHYEIAALAPADAVGLADGTALVIRPGEYPRGATGCLFPHEVAVVPGDDPDVVHGYPGRQLHHVRRDEHVVQLDRLPRPGRLRPAPVCVHWYSE
jgi:hypothetical protein